MPAKEFALLLQFANAHYPVSDHYERQHPIRGSWWSSQQEHVTAWLNELDGPGAYNRASRGLDARHMYNHFQCAPGLLWIAEALGEEQAVVQQAAGAAGGKGRPATQCAAIRRVIPWARILHLARHLT